MLIFTQVKVKKMDEPTPDPTARSYIEIGRSLEEVIKINRRELEEKEKRFLIFLNSLSLFERVKYYNPDFLPDEYEICNSPSLIKNMVCGMTEWGLLTHKQAKQQYFFDKEKNTLNPL
mgnify:CR=1 FL=1